MYNKIWFHNWMPHIGREICKTNVFHLSWKKGSAWLCALHKICLNLLGLKRAGVSSLHHCIWATSVNCSPTMTVLLLQGESFLLRKANKISLLPKNTASLSKRVSHFSSSHHVVCEVSHLPTKMFYVKSWNPLRKLRR